MKGEDRAGTGPAPLFIVPSHHSSLQAVLSQLRSIFDLIAQFKIIQVFVVLWRKWHGAKPGRWPSGLCYMPLTSISSARTSSTRLASMSLSARERQGQAGVPGQQR